MRLLKLVLLTLPALSGALFAGPVTFTYGWNECDNLATGDTHAFPGAATVVNGGSGLAAYGSCSVTATSNGWGGLTLAWLGTVSGNQWPDPDTFDWDFRVTGPAGQPLELLVDVTAMSGHGSMAQFEKYITTPPGGGRITGHGEFIPGDTFSAVGWMIDVSAAASSLQSGDTITITVPDATGINLNNPREVPTPEPATRVLLLLGTAALAARWKHRRFPRSIGARSSRAAIYTSTRRSTARSRPGARWIWTSLRQA